MIKKLRKKFILLALAVVAAVILVVVAGIDVANYLDMKSDADGVITFLEGQSAEPRGDLPQLPDALPEQPNGQKDGTFPSRNPPKGLPTETAFSARYFTVEADGSGQVTSSDLDRIAHVSSDDLDELVAKATSESGFVGNYRYHRTVTESGYRYLFLDCEKEIDATRTFIISSAIITSIGLAVIAILIILLSKKVLAPVEESYLKQRRFITDAGHELKTPLTVIGASAELLELEIGEGNEWLESIKGQTQKLGKLTKELVFLSRMDETDREIEKAPFSLGSALEECLEGFKEAALVAGKELSVEKPEDLVVLANEEMIRRALGLIIDNAIKYAEGREIRIRLTKEGHRAILEESNAASLAKGSHPELFERFYRPDESRSNETGGHGIGLSVVKSVLEANGGEASAESDGEKVTFRLTMPLAK